MDRSLVLDSAISVEAQRFAEAHGLADCLAAVVEATQKIFPSAYRRAVGLEEDPEVAGMCWLVFDVDVVLDVPASIAARHRWQDAVRQSCPPAQVCSFCLSLSLEK